MKDQILAEFRESFNNKHGSMHHIGKNDIRRKDCEVCQRQRIMNPKGYYTTFLNEQKHYWTGEMMKDVESFLTQALERVEEEAEKRGREECLLEEARNPEA